ncbi:MAG: hypothetical protein AABY18_00300 [Candidatus Thermoplasmatota archaeon]
MARPFSLGSLVVVLLLALAAAPTGQAQIQSCGDGLQLFIRNPDIVPDANGLFHVSGRLLLQFQVIGAEADRIEAFGLSFGLDLPTGDEVCALPPAAWLTGLYLEGYSVDLNKEDGFFIAINTNGQTSPQAQLGVAVHGYDAAHNEIARFWGLVDLDHCGSQPSLGCPESDFPDFTMPWPILLPGDGVTAPVEGFVFEFNEALSDLKVELNGIDVTAELAPWEERPDWDQDSFPDAGPGGLFLTAAAPCTLPEPIHTCGPLTGPAYQWTKRPLTDSDVVRILATDAKNNVAIKEIHIGSSVAGGTIADGFPILQMTFETSAIATAAGTTAIFPMVMQNTGGGMGHPFARAEVPAGWNYTWVPGHQPVPPGGSEKQQLEVLVPANATPGSYPIRALIDYRQGTEDETLESALTVDVVAGTPGGLTPQGAEDSKAGKGAPGIGPAALLAILALALITSRRA